MAGPTNAERLTRIETRLEGFERSISDNGKSAEAVMEMMADHVQETRQHREELKGLIQALDLKFTERVASGEKEMATMKARAGMFLAGLGFLASAAWALLTDLIKNPFTGGGA